MAKITENNLQFSVLVESLLPIYEEVLDSLSKVGAEWIQIDEPCLVLDLEEPVRNTFTKVYLRLTAVSKNIMRYSEFADIIEVIAAMDADVLSIETSRSQLGLLEVFARRQYPNEIVPGVYEIHSPRIPPREEIESLLQEILNALSMDQVWVNPDCGLKTRRWEEVIPALTPLMEAAKNLRRRLNALR